MASLQQLYGFCLSFFFFVSLKLENKFYFDKRTTTPDTKKVSLEKKNQNNVSISTLVQGADPYCQGVE